MVTSSQRAHFRTGLACTTNHKFATYLFDFIVVYIRIKLCTGRSLLSVICFVTYAAVPIGMGRTFSCIFEYMYVSVRAGSWSLALA